MKKQRLTKRQIGFVNDYVVEGNGTQAALKNYNIGGKHGTEKPEKVASVIATENLAKPSIIEAIEVKRQSLRKALEEQGITPKKIAEKVDVLLTAVDKEGNSDYNAIDKGLKHATNIYGIEDLDDKPKTNNTYNFIFNKDIQDEVKVIEAKIKEKLLKKHD